MDSIVLAAIIGGVATVAAAVSTVWGARGRRDQQTSAGDGREKEWRWRIAVILVLSLLVIVLTTFWYLFQVAE
jgi:H+/Cl- antiporter ClcA